MFVIFKYWVFGCEVNVVTFNFLARFRLLDDHHDNCYDYGYDYDFDDICYV
jgi:hypothetical protein